MPIVNLNTFDELGDLANKHEWLLLDFWAPWCAPCKVMNPVLEQFSELNPDNAIIKVDVDQKHEIAAGLPNNISRQVHPDEQENHASQEAQTQRGRRS